MKISVKEAKKLAQKWGFRHPPRQGNTYFNLDAKLLPNGETLENIKGTFYHIKGTFHYEEVKPLTNKTQKGTDVKP